MTDLTLRAYWRSHGDELAGDATAVFQFLTDTHELTRAFPLPQLVLCGSPEQIFKEVWRSSEHHLIESGMMRRDDIDAVATMLLRAARFMLAETRAENFTRRSITQKAGHPDRAVIRSAATGYEMQSVPVAEL